jgi:hypothetical protein
MAMTNGVEFYRGPSLLTGDPIVAIVTGFTVPSNNEKTGPMLQAWILRADVAPMEAKRRNLDAAVCGDCRHRGRHGKGSSCYVVPWLGPQNVYRQLGTYPRASWPRLRELMQQRHVRLGAYGDPAALPFEVWQNVLMFAAGWTGYTHQWLICDPRLKVFLMASVDDLDEFCVAREAGWRTFRVRGELDPMVATVEVACPASDEAGRTTTCRDCELCRGQAKPARSVSIIAHGNRSTTLNFYRKREA